ncbi:hypothetical protein, partial [Escherichia coli]|uniref:hypothetical protein n=1 Tax=Escherichia coli TaxID=562 RepID=UPI0010ABF746
MDRIKYLKWIAEESPTDDEIDNYDSIISRGAERAEKVQLSLRHCCKVSDEAAFCLIQRPYISKTLLT